MNIKKMSIFKQLPPTAGFPFFPKDILSLFSMPGTLEEDFQRYLQNTFSRVTYSGTAACFFILETIKKLSNKKTVIIPGFICPLIPLAIKRAGLNILACDTNRSDFGFDLNQLEELCRDNKDIAAIIPAHLAGIPVNVSGVKNISSRHGIFVIEDCAQGLGASYKDKKTGTIGDFAFFSLCRGKGLTIYEGGVMAVNNERFVKAAGETLAEFSNHDPLSEALKLAELAGYWIFYRPFLFWFVFNLPQKFWLWQNQPYRAAEEYYTEDFPTHEVSRLRKRFGHLNFWRLGEETEKQRKNALRYIRAIGETPGIKFITESAGDRASYSCLPLLCEDRRQRDDLLLKLNNSGLGAARMYLEAIPDYPYLKNMIQNRDVANAKNIAARHLTLTTSSYLTQREFDKIAGIIRP